MLRNVQSAFAILPGVRCINIEGELRPRDRLHLEWTGAQRGPSCLSFVISFGVFIRIANDARVLLPDALVTDAGGPIKILDEEGVVELLGARILRAVILKLIALLADYPVPFDRKGSAVKLRIGTHQLLETGVFADGVSHSVQSMAIGESQVAQRAELAAVACGDDA